MVHEKYLQAPGTVTGLGAAAESCPRGIAQGLSPRATRPCPAAPRGRCPRRGQVLGQAALPARGAPAERCSSPRAATFPSDQTRGQVRVAESPNPRTPPWQGWQGPLGIPHPTPCPSRVTQSRSPSTASSWGLSISREGDSTASLGSLGQGSVTLRGGLAAGMPWARCPAASTRLPQHRSAAAARPEAEAAAPCVSHTRRVRPPTGLCPSCSLVAACEEQDRICHLYGATTSFQMPSNDCSSNATHVIITVCSCLPQDLIIKHFHSPEDS